MSEVLRDALAANPALCATDVRISVVVPVYGALDFTLRCLQSVARHTRGAFRLIVINDGSPDPEISRVLQTLDAAAPNVTVVNRPQNLGFVRTVNEGFQRAGNTDVVLLNSDTIVTDDWLSRLGRVASSRPDVASVTPLTNNGTLCSVPVAFQSNNIPAGYDIDTFARLIANIGPGLYPQAPTGVGFCMYITRKALDAIGLFDANAFPRGYGEENDFSQRAIRAGFVNLIADDTFVFHEGGSSFGEATRDLLERNLREVARRHPRYLSDVDTFSREHPLRRFHDYLDRCTAAGRLDLERIRVLHVLHEGGGTEKHARELAEIDAPDVESYLLRSSGAGLQIDEFHRGTWLRTMRFPLKVPISVTGFEPHSQYAAALATACWSLRINLIHVHHLMGNAPDLVDVAARLDIPYVMTLHDYYMLCPTYTRLTGAGDVCTECTTGMPAQNASVCMARIGKRASDLLTYQEASHRVLANAQMLFVPHGSAAIPFASRFPDLRDRIRVVEHGHTFGAHDVTSSGRLSASTYAALHVAVIGGLEWHKGLSVFKQLLRVNRDERLVFHLYGTTPDPAIRALAPNVEARVENSRLVYHGPYHSHHIVARLMADSIDVGLQPAIWPETFSFTLSEMVAAGIPVIAGDLGAQGERVRRHRLGWTVPDIHDVRAVLAILTSVIDDPEVLTAARAQMDAVSALRSRAAMWNDYVAVYAKLVRAQNETLTMFEKPMPSPEYVAYLAAQAAEPAQAGAAAAAPADSAEVQWLRQRLRSPRHRIADAAANAVQKIPVIWPLIAATTEAYLRWETRRRRV